MLHDKENARDAVRMKTRGRYYAVAGDHRSRRQKKTEGIKSCVVSRGLLSVLFILSLSWSVSDFSNLVLLLTWERSARK